MGACVNLGLDEICTEIEPESWTLLLLFLEPINRVFTLVYFLGRNFFCPFIGIDLYSVI